MAKFLEKVKDMIIDNEDDEILDTGVEDTETEDEEKSKSEGKTMPSKVIVIDPRSFDEAENIANYLIHKKAVVLNIHRLSDTYAQRLLDYMSGVIFAIHGSRKPVDKNVYLFAPNELPVEGEIDAEI